MSQVGIFFFGVAVFFLGGVGLVLVGLDAFHSWSDDDEIAGEPAARAAEQARADAREDAREMDEPRPGSEA